MPQTQLVFFREASGRVPALEWLRNLKAADERGFLQCAARLKLLGSYGHELRRPAVDLLRDGIYELRARSGMVRYRILYFFYGRNTIVLDHAMIKKTAAVPQVDIEVALRRKRNFENDPALHSFYGELQDG